MFILVGPGGIGKSTWIQNLVPEEFENWVLPEYEIDPRNRDHVMTMITKWLVEFAEIDDTMRNGRTPALNALLSRNRDNFRPAYGKKNIKPYRRTVVFGTTEKGRYLQEAGGNRRYWSVQVGDVNARHGIDMYQLWAEVVQWYHNGATFHLDRDELAMVKLINSQFVASLNPFIQSLNDSGLQPAEPGKICQRLNITEMLDKIGVTPRDKRDRNAIGAWLRANGYVENNSTKKWDVTFQGADNTATQE